LRENKETEQSTVSVTGQARCRIGRDQIAGHDRGDL